MTKLAKNVQKVVDNIVIEHAEIGFRNFAGKASKFNLPGRKNFCVFLDRMLGITLEKDGWNVRWLDPREGEDESEAKPYIQVAVSYDNMPPKMVLVTSKGKTYLDNSTVEMLDWAEITNVDLIIRPYNWTVNGKDGVKAYVKSMYVTIEEDEFEAKYSDLPIGEKASEDAD